MTAQSRPFREKSDPKYNSQTSACSAFATSDLSDFSQRTILDSTAIEMDPGSLEILQEWLPIYASSDDETDSAEDKRPSIFPKSVHQSLGDEMRDILMSAEEMNSGILGARVYGQQVLTGETVPEWPAKRRRTAVAPKSGAQREDSRPLVAGYDVQVPIIIVEDSNGFAETEKHVPKPTRAHEPLAASAQSSTERRRGQMRQAQRNYRLRREATIAALEKRNQLLEKVVDGMTNAFMGLQEAAMQTSLDGDPEVAEQVRISTEEFLQWAREAQGPEDRVDAHEEQNGAESEETVVDRRNERRLQDYGLSRDEAVEEVSPAVFQRSICKFWNAAAG